MNILQTKFGPKTFPEFQEIRTVVLVLEWSDQAVMYAVQMVGVGSQAKIAFNQVRIRAKVGKQWLLAAGLLFPASCL
jgi:hypothetical protein